MIIPSKEQLAVIPVYENTLVVETIHYPDKVRNVSDVPNIPEEVKIEKKELDVAKMLIDQLTAQFEPEKYTDDYRTALLELIEEKKNNDETLTTKGKTVPDNAINLMDALQASFEKAKKEKPKPTQPKRKTTKKKKLAT